VKGMWFIRRWPSSQCHFRWTIHRHNPGSHKVHWYCSWSHNISPMIFHPSRLVYIHTTKHDDIPVKQQPSNSLFHTGQNQKPNDRYWQSPFKQLAFLLPRKNIGITKKPIQPISGNKVQQKKGSSSVQFPVARTKSLP
jgi:hypothetical protein